MFGHVQKANDTKMNDNLASFPGNDYIAEAFKGLQHGGEPPDNGPMEARVSVLEAKWESVIPTLATKSDIAGTKSELSELRADMHKGFADQTKWIIGTAVAGMAVFITVMTFVLNNAVPKASSPPQQPPIIINVPTQQAPTQAPQK